MAKIVNQIGNAIAYTREFGLRGAFDIVRQRHQDQQFCIHVAGFYQPFFCRNRGADFSMLRSVIGRRELNFPLNRKPRLIIDAGENAGYATRSFRRLYPDANIVAIEPDPSNCQAFRMNVRDAKVVLIQGVLWWRNTPLTITNPGASSCSFQMGESSVGGHQVASVTLPDIIRDHGPIDLLKIDIEGAEAGLFSHDADAWLANVGLIAIELHERYAPGVTDLVDRAVATYSCRKSRQGEYKLYDLKDWLA